MKQFLFLIFCIFFHQSIVADNKICLSKLYVGSGKSVIEKTEFDLKTCERNDLLLVEFTLQYRKVLEAREVDVESYMRRNFALIEAGYCRYDRNTSVGDFLFSCVLNSNKPRKLFLHGSPEEF